MVKSVQATLRHMNSTDELPRHDLCPTGEDSWCKYRVVQARGEVYHHKNVPIPNAIMNLLKPIYNRLGSRSLLQKCVHGYTQNANEELHSIVWKFCPKVLHLGKTAMDTACALAVSPWNDGMVSFHSISEILESTLTHFARANLQKRDIARIKKAKYKTTDRARQLRKKRQEEEERPT